VKKIDSKRIEANVAKTLGRDFADIKIVAVNVSPDLDQDGEDILRIEVVFEGALKAADARHVAGAARRLRPVLEEIDPDLYPVLTFVSKGDYERGHRRSETR